MVRVAGLQEYVDVGDRGSRARTAAARRRTISAIGATRASSSTRPPDVVCLDRESCARRWPSTESGSSDVRRGPTTRNRDELDDRYRRQIFPVLTPLAVGLGRPFPYISNLSLSLAVLVRHPQTGQ